MYVCACACVHVRVYVCACVCVYMCMCACVCMSESCICTCMCIYTLPCSLSLSFALPVFLFSGGLPNVQHAMLLVNTKLLTICGRCVHKSIKFAVLYCEQKSAGSGTCGSLLLQQCAQLLAFCPVIILCFSSRSPQVATADILLMTLFICRHFLEDPTQDEPPIFDGG